MRSTNVESSKAFSGLGDLQFSLENDEDQVQGHVDQQEVDPEFSVSRSVSQHSEDALLQSHTVIEVHVSAPARPWEYENVEVQDGKAVDSVLRELRRPGNDMWYRILFADGREEDIPFEELLKLRSGAKALDIYQDTCGDESSSSQVNTNLRQQFTIKPSMSNDSKHTGSSSHIYGSLGSNRVDDDDENEEQDASDSKRRRLSKPKPMLRLYSGSLKRSSKILQRAAALSDDESSEDQRKPLRKSNRAKAKKHFNYNDSKGLNGSEIDELAPSSVESSDNVQLSSKLGIGSGKARGPGRPRGRKKRKLNYSMDESDSAASNRPEPTRVSGRSNKAVGNMRERLEDEEMYADEIHRDIGTKVASVREVIQPLPNNSSFRIIHNNQCDICEGTETTSNKGPSPLVYCQGCTISIHQVCLGYRNAREHLVTKVGEDNFVLQCRRCIGNAAKKDHTAPRLDICQGCKEPGAACTAFAPKRTSKQEEILRQDNGGEDPITSVADNLINNAENILFRCTSCHRGYHFEHLPPLDRDSVMSLAVEEIRDDRFEEYKKEWICKDCIDAPAKVQTLIAWRPVNVELYTPGHNLTVLSQDSVEYLVKWESHSYFRCTWMSGGWVWGVTPAAMRKAFERRGENGAALLKMNEVDAIPEEYLRMEIVMDVQYSSKVNTHTEEIDNARINEVKKVFVKFQGLGYEEAVWELPPNPTETERWADFVTAYNEYVAGKYFKQPSSKMKNNLQAYRDSDFEDKILSDSQPTSLTGGQLMSYQLEGMNWLLYNFHRQKNVILADEMGLGKTIQVIAALTTLIKDKPQCWPFLIVVPNSTCPNWRREIKTWAPSLRVVAYYGSKAARQMAMKYELYPDESTELRAHIVITSYEAPVQEDSAWFRKVKWAGMIVDEGQRLKNEKNLIFGALSALKVPFRVLLTGTPVQNNKRELFTLLQFLDRNISAATLDENYAELTNENLSVLHDLIRPYLLRRTKAQVLKFLPPMAQMIIPVTMSVVQKKLYKSILAKSPDLIRTIFVKDQSQLRLGERGSLNNILMQLRKCLCHPFAYSAAIEEKSANYTVLHRNLVDASSKLQLLEIMLPKLRERGHRVLIFSQFLKQLDIIEDFLDGLGLSFQRLDGNVGTLEKQKRIDAYNAPDSTMFAFLLSTRAGGVGINLATADTVIIMDPDFNPHQDIQALSRAHRIGQKKKVLVFQLMTKDSAEEKIVQIGRRKMALDHALIEAMDADDDAGIDLQSVLRHGAQALFDDDNRNDIHYDSASVDKLLDRSQIENTDAGDDKSAESAFSYARIWSNDKGVLIDDVGDANSEDSSPKPGVWDKILKQREADAAREEAAKQKMFGRGKRARQHIDYHSNLGGEDESFRLSPTKQRAASNDASLSDTDFAVRPESEVEDDYDERFENCVTETDVLRNKKSLASRSIAGVSPANSKQGMPKNGPRKTQSPSKTPRKPQKSVVARTKSLDMVHKPARKRKQDSSPANIYKEGADSKKTQMLVEKPKGVANPKSLPPKTQPPKKYHNLKHGGGRETSPDQWQYEVAKHLGSLADDAPSPEKSSPEQKSGASKSVKLKLVTGSSALRNSRVPENLPAKTEPVKRYRNLKYGGGKGIMPGEYQYEEANRLGPWADSSPSSDSSSHEQESDSSKPVKLKPTSKSSTLQLDDFQRAKPVRNRPLPTSSHQRPQKQPKPLPYHGGSQNRQCHACQKFHATGFCPLKRSGVENCGLCGLAHYGDFRSCPHFESETQVRLMLDALKASTESQEEIELARNFLRSVIGSLVRAKWIQQGSTSETIANQLTISSP